MASIVMHLGEGYKVEESAATIGVSSNDHTKICSLGELTVAQGSNTVFISLFQWIKHVKPNSLTMTHTVPSLEDGQCNGLLCSTGRQHSQVPL